MPFELLDRRRVRFKPLSERENRVEIETQAVHPGDEPRDMPDGTLDVIAETAERVRQARRSDRPVIMAFGAHAIKNGLAPVLIHMMEKGWLTHLATNGAGIIHDWEFAFQGKSSEHVARNIACGEFGNWEETGFYINLALILGAWGDLGYGECVGRMIMDEALDFPSPPALLRDLTSGLGEERIPEHAAAAADLLTVIDAFRLATGCMEIKHPWKQYSAQSAACRLGVPLTGHPMFGHDIIYNHPLCHGASVGRTALRDYLAFARSVSRLAGGVYMSVGSAVMSPMIFEKSFSMAQNIALQEGQRIEDHFMVVVDLARSGWDWKGGEPPEDHPDYYLRFYKTFNRMGGTLRYVCGGNRDFLLHLCRMLGD